MLRPTFALAVVALLLVPLFPSPALAVAGASTTISLHPNCTGSPGGQARTWGCIVSVETTTATSGFDVQLGFAWIPSGGFAGPDGVNVVFTRPVITCPAAAGAACSQSSLYLNASMTTWAPDTWGFAVYATRLCGGVPCSPADESSFSSSFVILRPSSLSIYCLPTSAALFTHFTCEAWVSDVGGAGVPSTPVSPSQVVWPFDDGANQHDWGACNLIAQATPYTAACAQLFWVSFVEDGTIVASWAGDASHNGDSGTGHITRTPRATDIVPGCTATILIGAQVVCNVELWDIEWEDTRFEQGISGDILGNSSSPGSGLSATESVLCAAAMVPFPDPATCSFSFWPTTHGTKTVRLHYDANSIYGATTAFANVNVLRRATSTLLSCAPSVPVNTPATCNVNVTDTTLSSAPTGNVAFTIDGVSPALPVALLPGGAFSASSCALVPVPTSYPSSTCSVTFTPSLGVASAGDSDFTLRAAYGGDTIHDVSAATAPVEATRRATTTTLACTNDILIALSGLVPAGSCAATVTDVSPATVVAPMGTVEWMGTLGAGLPTAFPSATTCLLDAIAPLDCDPGAFTPTTIGDHVVTGRYGGDVDHFGGQDADTVHVHAATATVYNGAQSVIRGTSFSASAIVTSGVASCYQNRAADATGVAFFLDRNPTTGTLGEWQIPGYAGTNGGGKGTLSGIATSGWQSGVYILNARSLGDSWCDASHDEATLVVAGPGDIAHGGGWVALNGRTNFAFVITKIPKTDPAQYRGQFLMINQGKWKLTGDLTTLVKHAGTPVKCGADGVGELSYAYTDPATGRVSWLPAIGDPLTNFGLYFEDGGGGGKRSMDKLAIQISHVIVSPPEPNQLPKATSANAAALKSGDIKCG